MEERVYSSDSPHVLTLDESYNIQILRGLSIIAVVFIHNPPPGLSQVFCRPFLNFAVGMFLFLSGMLSNAQKWNPKKRIAKVLIPYVLWTFAYILFDSFNTPLDIPIRFVKSLVFGNASAVMYYIFIYIELTLLIPFIDMISKSRCKYIVFAIPFLEIIFFRLLPVVFNYKFNLYVSNMIRLSCIGWFAFFYYGYLLGNHRISLNGTFPQALAVLLVCLALQIAEGYWYHTMGSANYGTQMKITSVLTSLVFCNIGYRFIISNKKHVLKTIKILGDCSFGIFFSHIFFMNILALIPGYQHYAFFPLKGILVLFVSTAFVFLCRLVLKKHSKYLAC